MTLEHMTTAAEILGLLIIIGTVIFIITRLPRNNTYRFAFGLAFLGAMFLLWVNLAVGIIGEPENMANLMYVAVLAVGAIGALVARFKPHGMSRTLFAMAIAQVLVAVITVIADLGAPVTPVLSLLILNGILIAFWVGSAWLFRRAALA